MAYEFTNSRGIKYHLHSREVRLKGSNRLQVIYFFSKTPGEGAIEEMPAGWVVVENTKTGLPVLKRQT